MTKKLVLGFSILLSVVSFSHAQVTNGTFAPADKDIYGQTILPTTRPSITITPEGYGVEVPFTNLPNNAPISHLFQTTVDLEKTGYIFRSFGTAPGNAFTYRIDIPSWYEGGTFRIQTNENSQGMDMYRMVTISEKRGDFDTVKATQSGPSNLPLDNCYSSLLHADLTVNVSSDGRTVYEYEQGGALRNVMTQTVMTPAMALGMRKAACIIKPGKTYYVNVRFTVPSGMAEFKTMDGCAWYNKLNGRGTQEYCGTLVQIQNNANIPVLKQLASKAVSSSGTQSTATGGTTGDLLTLLPFNPNSFTTDPAQQTITSQTTAGTGNSLNSNSSPSTATTQTVPPTSKASITDGAEARGTEVAFSNLPNNAPLVRLYQTTINPEKNAYIFRSFSLPKEEAVTYQIDIPEWMDGVRFQVQANENTLGMDVGRLITVSEKKGDFDTTKVRTQVGSQLVGDNCYIEGLHTSMEFSTSKNGRSIYEYEEGGSLRNSITKSIMSPAQVTALKKQSCILVPGKTYYVNVRFTSPVASSDFKTTDGCALAQKAAGSEASCGTLVQIVHSGKIDVLKQLQSSAPQALVPPPSSSQTLPTPSASSGTSPVGDVDIAQTGTEQCTQLNYDLRRGMSDVQVNNEVSELQDFLNPQYLRSNPVGYFGAGTFAAVQAFQRANGLPASGFVGPLTRAKIKSVSCGGVIPTVGAQGTTSAGGTTLTASPASGTAPLAVTFSAKAEAVKCSASPYSMNFGDGVYEQIKPVSTTGTLCNNFQTTHTYKKSGTYTASLRKIVYSECPAGTSATCAVRPLRVDTLTSTNITVDIDPNSSEAQTCPDGYVQQGSACVPKKIDLTGCNVLSVATITSDQGIKLKVIVSNAGARLYSPTLKNAGRWSGLAMNFVSETETTAEYQSEQSIGSEGSAYILGAQKDISLDMGGKECQSITTGGGTVVQKAPAVQKNTTTQSAADTQQSTSFASVNTFLSINTNTNTSTAVTTTDKSVDGVVLPNSSKSPFVVPSHAGANGAGELIHAYAMNPSRCTTNLPLTSSWQHNIDLNDFVGKSAVEKFELKPNEALTYKFTPSQTGTYVLYYDQTTRASNAPTFLSVSSSPCDFALTKLTSASPSYCYASRGNGLPNQVTFTVGSSESLATGACALKAGNTYYFNIRNQDMNRPQQDACESDGVAVNGQKLCGGLISFMKTQ